MEIPVEKELSAELDDLRTCLGNDPVGAVIIAATLAERATNISNLKLKGDIFHATGLAFHKTGRYARALEWYTQAFDVRKLSCDKKGMSLSLNNIGMVNHDTGQFKEAIPYYIEAIAIKQELNEFQSLTATYENLGVVYQKLSEYKKAMEVYYKSLKISEELGDNTRMALSYQNMGVVHLALGNTHSALDMFMKARELRADGTDTVSLIQLENNIGFVYLKTDRYDAALKSFEHCLELSESIDYRTGIMAAYNNKGEIFLELGRYEDAINAYRQCYRLALRHGDVIEQSASSANLGDIYIKLEKYDDAYNYLQTALRLSKKIEDKAKGQQIYWHLIQVHEKKGRLAEALDCYRQYETLKSIVMSARSADDINELKTKYEVEKKEKEVQQARLLQVESELKALRAQMDPHFIFNALGSMRKELLEGNLDRADQYIVRFSRLLRLILDTTRSPSVRLSDNIELLNLYMQIEQARQNNRFDYKITLGKGIRPDEIFVPGMVLQPLVENAIIHGLFNKEDGQGKLSIAFTKSGKELKITVNDNGVGRSGKKQVAESGHKSHATSIIRETLQLTWKDRSIEEVFMIKDKVNKKGEPLGTEVTVLLPLG